CRVLPDAGLRPQLLAVGEVLLRDLLTLPVEVLPDDGLLERRAHHDVGPGVGEDGAPGRAHALGTHGLDELLVVGDGPQLVVHVSARHLLTAGFDRGRAVGAEPDDGGHADDDQDEHEDDRNRGQCGPVHGAAEPIGTSVSRGTSSSSRSVSSAAARAGSPGQGRYASSALIRAPDARRLSRTSWLALSSSPRMRTARCAIVTLRIPSRTHSTRRRARSSSAAAAGGGGPYRSSHSARTSSTSAGSVTAASRRYASMRTSSRLT